MTEAQDYDARKVALDRAVYLEVSSSTGPVQSTRILERAVKFLNFLEGK